MEGEIEFNVDQEVSYKFTDLENGRMTLPQAQCVQRFFEALKGIFNSFGSIEKIKIEPLP